MKDLIRRIIIETVTDKEIICDKCGWSWDIVDGGDDLYICHKCGHDNEPKSQSNLNKLLGKFKTKFPDDLKDKVDIIEKFIVNYIQDHNFTVKFLNSCSTGFNGVRTKDQIIICSPNSMSTLGDFIYTVFHEIRHEEQMDKTGIGLDNHLKYYDLNYLEHLHQLEAVVEEDLLQHYFRQINDLLENKYYLNFHYYSNIENVLLDNLV
jgi:hypothetical protein